MNEEEIIYILENWFLPKAIESRKQGLADIEQIKFMEAIQGLLDLYKEKNKQIQVEIEGRNILVGLNENLKEELKKEKEKNKELYEDNQKQWAERCKLAIELDNNTVSKDKIKEIIYPTPTNPISYEIQTSDMYKKLLELLEEE